MATPLTNQRTWWHFCLAAKSAGGLVQAAFGGQERKRFSGAGRNPFCGLSAPQQTSPVVNFFSKDSNIPWQFGSLSRSRHTHIHCGLWHLTVAISFGTLRVNSKSQEFALCSHERFSVRSLNFLHHICFPSLPCLLLPFTFEDDASRSAGRVR